MKKIQVVLMAIIAMTMSSCLFKTEATVDVTVKNPLGITVGAGELVYKFNGSDFSVNHKENANGSVATDASGVARFELKSPGDFVPSGVGYEDQQTFIFCTYDKDGNLNGQTAVTVKPGEKKNAEIKQTIFNE